MSANWETTFNNLGFDQVKQSPLYYAGFLPDFSVPPFQAYQVTADERLTLSPLVNRRRIKLSDGAKREVVVYLYVGARGGAEARQAIALELSSFTRPLALTDGRVAGLSFGEYTSLEDAPSGPQIVVFGRNNVALLLLNHGSDQGDLRSMAKMLDDQLVSNLEYREADLEAVLPNITALYMRTDRIDTFSSVPLVISASCPMGQTLLYSFEATHGAINRISNTPPRFSYQTGMPQSSSNILTATVTSECGLSATRRIDFSIGAGDLGYIPGFGANAIR